MIAKKRECPVEIQVGQAYLRRLPERHPMYRDIERYVEKRKAKYKREKRADDYLAFLPRDGLLVFQGLPFKNGSSRTLIDTLILTRAFVLIIEYNHLSDTIYMDPAFDQLIQHKGKAEKGWPDPFYRLQKQKRFLQAWARARHLPELPVEYLVIFCHETAEVKAPPANTADEQKICLANQAVYKINRLRDLYGQPVLDSKHFKKWEKHLLTHHPPAEIFPFKIDWDAMYMGVRCPVCRRFEMEYKDEVWRCQYCGHADKISHRQAIEDFFLLVSKTAVEQDLCDFLRLGAEKTAKLLQEMGLCW
ncbi:hypothetical protein BpJC4_11080 [Weizmannia acidilactici]|nr:hypothetical protein BpJC4_11080 [Weizmannia acidilactici]GER72796.1 hypothetical protein BpPP18_08630 [Weizmannia acidilactici]